MQKHLSTHIWKEKKEYKSTNIFKTNTKLPKF